MPPLAISSASGTVATQMPVDPAASWCFEISTHLCALAWGRRALPDAFAWAAICRRLASKASRSSRSAGVGI